MEPESGRAVPIALVANVRLPSQRANSLQVTQAAAALARAGHATRLLHALRHGDPAQPGADRIWDYYTVPEGARPELIGIDCIDWIERAPRRLQYLPARLQELSFARRAARELGRSARGAWILTREIEVARGLAPGVGRGLFLEIHRVPGGRLRRRWLRAAARRAQGVLAISGGVRDDLLELGLEPEALRVEHDGYEARRFEGLPERGAARAALELEGREPLVVYTGGLLAWKGVDLVLAAARRMPAVRFVIAGGMDADVARLRQAAAGLANLRIDGFQAPERIPLYLAAGDVGLVPNRSQPAISARYTSPLKVFEAMACSLPLIVSDLPSLREILGAGGALFVAPDDVGALVEGLEHALGDAGLRERLAREIGARAAEYSWDARARRILNWMSERSAAGPELGPGPGAL